MAEKKQLTERQNALIDAMMGEAQGDIRTAMRMAGYSDHTTIQEAIRPIQAEVVEAASMMIAMNSPKAAGKMVGVLDDPDALGAKNILVAAKEVLDRAGIVKTEKHEVETTGASMFILPPKNVDD